MAEELVLARVGMNMEEATVAKWRKQPGDTFTTGEAIYDIETDKVTYEVEAQFAGRIVEIKVAEGETAQVGQAVATAERQA